MFFVLARVLRIYFFTYVRFFEKKSDFSPEKNVSELAWKLLTQKECGKIVFKLVWIGSSQSITGVIRSRSRKESRSRDSASPRLPRAEVFIGDRFFVGVTEGVVAGRPRQQQQSSSVEKVLILRVNYEYNKQNVFAKLESGPTGGANMSGDKEKRALSKARVFHTNTW